MEQIKGMEDIARLREIVAGHDAEHKSFRRRLDALAESTRRQNDLLIPLQRQGDAIESMTRALREIKLAVEQVEGSLKLGAFKFDPSKRYALVMGNEVKGVRQDVVDACDQALEIPQYGTKHSMNVSVTAGIVMWEATSAFR